MLQWRLLQITEKKNELIILFLVKRFKRERDRDLY